MRWFAPLLPLVLIACSGDDDPVDTDVADTDVVQDTDVEDTDVETTCGPTELCTRSIDECEVVMTLDTCEGWYANSGNCADMDAYTACNCECISQATCDGYFACGNLCFNDHCE